MTHATMPNTSPQWRSVPGMSADHIGFADMMRRRMVETFRIAKGAGDEMVQDRNGDIVQQQTADGFIDGAIVPQCSSDGQPEPARHHAGERHGGRTTMGGAVGMASAAMAAKRPPITTAPSPPMMIKPR